MRVIHLVVALCSVAIIPSSVMAQTPQQDPAAQYDAVLKTLTPAQQKILSDLGDKVTQAYEPKFSRDLAVKRYQLCIASKPDQHVLYNRKMHNLRNHLDDDFESKRNAVWAEMKAVDFIDQKILSQYTRRQVGIQVALMDQLGNVALQAVDKEKQCAELKADLDGKYSVNYAKDGEDNAFSSIIMRDQVSSAVSACLIGFKNKVDDRVYTASIVLTPEKDAKGDLSYSQKLLKPDGSYAKIQEGWIDFGAVNTREAAKQGQRNAEMLMAGLPEKYIVDIVDGLTTEGATLFYRATELGDPVAIYVKPVAKEKLQDVVNCASTVNPALKPMFVEKGFSPIPYAAGVVDPTKKDPYYTVAAMSSDVDKPQGCTIQIVPPAKDPSGLGAGVLMYDYIRPDFPYNQKTSIMMIGQQVVNGKPVRAVIKDAWFVAGKEGVVFDTRLKNPEKEPGARYLINMDQKAAIEAAEALAVGGVLLAAVIEGKSDPATIIIPPMRPETLTSFKICAAKFLDKKAQ